MSNSLRSFSKFASKSSPTWLRLEAWKRKKRNTQMSKKKKRLGPLNHLYFLGVPHAPLLNAVLPQPSGRGGGEMQLLHQNEWGSAWLLAGIWQVVCTEELVLRAWCEVDKGKWSLESPLFEGRMTLLLAKTKTVPGIERLPESTVPCTPALCVDTICGSWTCGLVAWREGQSWAKMKTFLRHLLRNVCTRESQNQDILKSLMLRMSWTAN